jgi:hypothetical protein
VATALLLPLAGLVGCASPTSDSEATAVEQELSVFGAQITAACVDALDQATRSTPRGGAVLSAAKAKTYASDAELGRFEFRIVRATCSSKDYREGIVCGSSDVRIDSDTFSSPVEDWSYRYAKAFLAIENGKPELRLEPTVQPNSLYAATTYDVEGSFENLSVDMQVRPYADQAVNLRRDLGEVKDDDGSIVLHGRLGSEGLYLEKTSTPRVTWNVASCARIVGSMSLPTRAQAAD